MAKRQRKPAQKKVDELKAFDDALGPEIEKLDLTCMDDMEEDDMEEMEKKVRKIPVSLLASSLCKHLAAENGLKQTFMYEALILYAHDKLAKEPIADFLPFYLEAVQNQK